MSVETQQMMSSDPASLRKQREESIAEKRRLLDELKLFDNAIQASSQSCPEKRSGNIDELEERIADLEEELEVGSHSAKEEKSLKRELQTLKRSYDDIMNYERARRELDILRDMRREKQKQLADVNKRLDDLTDALESGITLARIEKLSGKKVVMSGWSDA